MEKSYTSKSFRQKIIDTGMTQSMSRVARCIDNGPMEGFWGIMKQEMYYGKKYKTKDELITAIIDYMNYYTNKRVQRNLGILTPMEYHNKLSYCNTASIQFIVLVYKISFAYIYFVYNFSMPYYNNICPVIINLT